MKKFATIIMTSAALLSATPAMASHKVLLADVTVQKGTGPVLNCVFKLDLDHPATGQVTITVDSSTTDLRCYSMDFNPNANTASYPTHNYTGTGSNFTISGIDVDTTITPGDCAGSLLATWNGIDWDVSGTLPQITSGGDCTIDGVVS